MLRNQDRLYRTALAITRSKTDAEDAVQDTFVKLLQKQPKFNSPEHETAWLIRVTVNLCKNTLRKQKPSQLLEDYPAQDPVSHELMETVMSLPPKYRLVIHLYYYEGYATKEIAAMTKQKEGTVREQLTRARRLLKKYLLEEENQEEGEEL